MTPDTMVDNDKKLCEELTSLLKVPPIPGECAFEGRAESLPSALKLRVGGKEGFKVPLDDKAAKKIISRCSPEAFEGQDCKRWYIDMKKVSILNTDWENGLSKLSSVIAHRMGYINELELVPQKLMIHKAGGEQVKLVVTLEDDRAVAMLMVQPPSIHSEGGVRVIFEDEAYEYCSFNLGASADVGRFFPHFAVFHTSAQYELEPVRTGYRLMLLYIVRVPFGKVKRRNTKTLEHLFWNIEEIKSLVVYLTHNYTDEEIAAILKQGWKALKGDDRGRFCSLKAADEQLDNDMLRFFLVRLSKSTRQYDDSEVEERFIDKWLTEDDKEVPSEDAHDNILRYRSLFRDTLYPMHQRYAIVVWSMDHDLDNYMTFVGCQALLDEYEYGHTSFPTILDLFEKHSQSVSVELHRGLVELLISKEESYPAVEYSQKCLHRRSQPHEAIAMVPIVIRLLKAYSNAVMGHIVGWSLRNGVARLLWYQLCSSEEIRNSFVDVLTSCFTSKPNADVEIEAVPMQRVWELAILSWNFEQFKRIVGIVEYSESRWIKRSVNAIVGLSRKLTASRRTTVESLINTRIRSIESDIAAATRMETWEIPDASFPNAPHIEKFLRGPDETMTLPSSTLSVIYPHGSTSSTSQSVEQVSTDEKHQLTWASSNSCSAKCRSITASTLRLSTS